MAIGQHRLSSHPPPEPAHPQLQLAALSRKRPAVSGSHARHAAGQPAIAQVSVVGRAMQEARRVRSPSPDRSRTASNRRQIDFRNRLLFLGTLDSLDRPCPGGPVADLVVAPIRVCLATFVACFVSPDSPHADLCRRGCVPLANLLGFCTSPCHLGSPPPIVSFFLSPPHPRPCAAAHSGIAN